MRDLSSLDFRKIVDELQFLVGSRLDKVFLPSSKELILQVHLSGSGKMLVKAVVPKFLCISASKPSLSAPSGFCVFLRKKIDVGFIRSIELVGSERLVKLVFESKEGLFDLFLEFFGKGNIILCKDGKILGVSEQQKLKDRTVAKDEAYSVLKKDFNVFNISKTDFCGVLKKSEEAVGRCLAVNFGIGGLFSQEICLISHIDKNVNAKDADGSVLYDSLKKLLNEDTKPLVVLKDGAVKDVIPFDLQIYKDFEKKSFDSFSDALDFAFKSKPAVSANRGNIERLNAIIESQSAQVIEQEKEAEVSQKMGELIYENYALVEDVIKTLKSVWGKTAVSEIKDKVKGHKHVKDVLKNGDVVLDL